jgi:hypothetical protein
MPFDERQTLTAVPSEDLGADFKKALDEGWLPIREVARQTGVNAITLRAWERRYGLSGPAAHAQGPSSLLERTCAADSGDPHMDQPWRGSQSGQTTARHTTSVQRNGGERLATACARHCSQAVTQLSERSLDDSINQAMALYPPRTLCEQLLMPLLAELEQRWQGQFGAQMERVFFYSWLRSKFGARIYHNNRQLNAAAPLLLINHSDLPLEPHLWLCAWLISSADCPVQVFDWPLPAGELALTVDHLQARGVLLYSSKAMKSCAVAETVERCELHQKCLSDQRCASTTPSCP